MIYICRQFAHPKLLTTFWLCHGAWVRRSLSFFKTAAHYRHRKTNNLWFINNHD